MTRRTAAEIREYCEKAGREPWHTEVDMVAGSHVIDADRRWLVDGQRFEGVHDFMVNARTDLPVMLADAVELREVLEDLMVFGHDGITISARDVYDRTAYLADGGRSMTQSEESDD